MFIIYGEILNECEVVFIDSYESCFINVLVLVFSIYGGDLSFIEIIKLLGKVMFDFVFKIYNCFFFLMKFIIKYR